jgi:hypothetical protein
VSLSEIGVFSTPTIDPVGFQKELDLKISRAANLDQLIGVWACAEFLSPLPISQLVLLATKFSKLVNTAEVSKSFPRNQSMSKQILRRFDSRAFS